MSKALVNTEGTYKEPTFRTKWSTFMKNNIFMNLLFLMTDCTLSLSSAALSFWEQLPKAMVDKADGDDFMYFFFFFKDDNNVIQTTTWTNQYKWFTEPKVIGGVDWLTPAAITELQITTSGITEGLVYPVTCLYSLYPIIANTIVNPGDLPYTASGKVSSYVIDVTAVA